MNSSLHYPTAPLLLFALASITCQDTSTAAQTKIQALYRGPAPPFGLAGNTAGLHRRHPAGKGPVREFNCQISRPGERGALVFIVFALRHENVRRHKVRRSQRWRLEHRFAFGTSAGNRAASKSGYEN